MFRLTQFMHELARRRRRSAPSATPPGPGGDLEPDPALQPALQATATRSRPTSISRAS